MLFPICGSLRNDQAQIGNGRITKMPRHGIVRKREFTCCNIEKNNIAFFIESNDEMYQQYPYKFRLIICYRLDGRQITTEYQVENMDHEKMPFFIGGHKDAIILDELRSKSVTFCLEGYKVDAVRCLLKNDDYLEKAVNECLEAVLQKMDYEEHKMAFKFQTGKKEICLEDVVYIESNLHKLIFHMVGEAMIQHTMYEKLDHMDERLKGVGFCRIHKSYLVNLKYVEDVERYKVALSDGESLRISKARYLDAKNEFACYRSKV